MIPFSPGVVQGCLDLIKLLDREPLPAAAVISAFGHLGGAPTPRVLEAAGGLGWIVEMADGRLTPASKGEQLVSLSGPTAMIRRAILDLVEATSPPWLRNASYGRRRVLAFVAKDIGQLFVEADLVVGIDEEVVTFWDTLAGLARTRTQDQKLATGREGERLTLRYEEARTGIRPQWIAIENNDDGYDVLSVRARDDLQPLTIEVKASTAGIAGTFHLTQREWRRACDSALHLFHLWDLSGSGAPRLAVATSEEVRQHVPADSGKGAWELVAVPFEAFKEHFAHPM